MIFAFGDLELDIPRGELRSNDAALPIEPRAFKLLCMLVENNERLVSKEELIEKVWDGRIVSDTAISTGIKAVRKALGDDGEKQEFVKTVRGRGFRFTARVRRIRTESDNRLSVDDTSSASQAKRNEAETVDRPSIAVLPFRLIGHTDAYSAIADAIPAELIASLSRLRWLWVLARGSTFRFRNRETELNEIRESLGTNYLLSGIVEIFGKNVAVAVELVDTRTAAVIWADRFPSKIDDIHETRSQIADQVIAALEIRIPLHEAEKARLRSPEDLDAWSAYHVGLQHMYRFNQKDNEVAAHFLETATNRDPRFARAFAARSFASFQSAFLRYSGDTETDKALALRFAEKSVELDPLDPFCNFNLARTHWLNGNPDGGLELLNRSVQLSPNFAQGLYARAWTDVMAGRGTAARTTATTAIALSPLDPLLYAMQATLGLSYLLEGNYKHAADWAEKGARAPGAHFLIGAIAVAAHQLNGNESMANYWAENIRSRRSDVSAEHFFNAFPFSDMPARKKIGAALAKSGL